MNHFADLELELLQIAEEDSAAPIAFAFRAEGREPLLVTVPAGLEQLSMGEASGSALTVDLRSLASPGRTVVLGRRELHLQFLRADNPICRGPLLVFEQGEPLPCFRGKVGFWQRLVRTKEKALVPVHLVGAGDEATRAKEIEAGLNLAVNLMKGHLRPGLPDGAYLA